MQLFEILVVFLYKYSYYRKLPFREYALPLKRERWHAKRAGEGATCRGGFAYAQHDTMRIRQYYNVKPVHFRTYTLYLISSYNHTTYNIYVRHTALKTKKKLKTPHSKAARR